MLSHKRKLDAFLEGCKAAKASKPLKSNPHLDEHELWLEWRRGYLSTLVAINENNTPPKGAA
jgi:hypothetical protein